VSRRPSPRGAIALATLMAGAMVAVLLVSYFRDLPAYRDGTAPELSGVVVSQPTHRHMTCGRSQDGYQVEVRYAVGTSEREEPLETCDPSALPEGASVAVWERRPDVLTTAPPGEHHEMSIFLGVIVALWALVVGWSVSRMRRTAQ